MCSGSEAGSYLRLIDVVYHSTLGLRVMKKKKPSFNVGVRHYHTVDFASFVASDIEGLRDQLCTAYGPKVNCARQVDL